MSFIVVTITVVERDILLGTEDITVGGDQGIRVCIDSSKHNRLGTHTRQERLEPLNPVMIEMFHVQQDLLEVLLVAGV